MLQERGNEYCEEVAEQKTGQREGEGTASESGSEREWQ